MFKKATRNQSRARVAIDGPAKAGKSMTALRCAFALGSKVAAIDTEYGRLSLYVGESPDGEGPFDFDVINLRNFSPQNYINEIRDAERDGYEVLIIDSLSHAWAGEGGILDQADKSSKQGFTKWADLTPQHRKLVDTILGSPLHIVCTMRSKMEWVLEKNDYTGKMEPRKVGLAPVQRDGMEYEFDLLCSVNTDHLVTVTGSRCSAMDGAMAPKPGAAFFRPYVDWLTIGTPRAESANGQYVSADQLNRIDILGSQLGILPAGLSSRIEVLYGVKSTNDLTAEQATDLETRMETAINAKLGSTSP